MSLSMPLVASPDADDARTDAHGLRQAREARGLTVSEAARWLTLSRSQIEQIEQGGFSAFYSRAHKALAIRKYASAVGLDPDAVLGLLPPPAGPQPGPEPIEPMHEVAAIDSPPAGSRATAASSALDSSLAESPDTSVPVTAMRLDALASGDARKTARSMLLGLLIFCAVAIVFAIVRGGIDRWAGASHEIAAPGADDSLPPAMTVPVTHRETRIADMATHADMPACTASPLPAQVAEWSPAYVRKPGTRLYISGPSGSEVCVYDSAGKISRLVLMAGTVQAVDGRPPYVVQSASLDALRMFLQGLKVKVPAQAASIRVMPGQRPVIREADATDAAPSS